MQTQITGLNGLNEVICASPQFKSVPEAAEITLGVARQLHDGVRQRLQFAAMRCLNGLMDFGFYRPELKRVAVDSLGLRYFKTRQIAYQIIEKMVLTDRYAGDISAAKNLFLLLQQKKYD